MADAPINGALIQGANGEFYFISAKDLEMYRLSAKEAARTKELLGPRGVTGAVAGQTGKRVAVLNALFGPIGTAVKTLDDDPTVSKVLRDDPTVSKFLRDDPTVSKVLRDDPTVSKKLRDDPTVSKISRVMRRSARAKPKAKGAAKKTAKKG
jgi:hypothetical protein